MTEASISVAWWWHCDVRPECYVKCMSHFWHLGALEDTRVCTYFLLFFFLFFGGGFLCFFFFLGGGEGGGVLLYHSHDLLTIYIQV